MTLEEILKEIEVQRGFQNADTTPEIINGGIPNSEIARTNALAIAKRQASTRIAELRNAYDRIIYQNSAVIFAKGNKVNLTAFGELAAADDALVVSSNDFFADIVAAAEAQMSYQRIMNVGVGQEIVDRIARAMSNMVATSGVIRYPRLPMTAIDSVLKTKEEVLAVAKAVAAACTEVPLALTWLERGIASRAFQKGFASEPLPVVVLVEEGDDIAVWARSFMAASPSVTVDLDSHETAEEALSSAREALVQKMGDQA